MSSRLAIQLVQFAALSIILIVLLVGLTALTQERAAEPEPVSICGTTYTEGPYGRDYVLGKTLWNANGCGSCHAKDMKSDLTGPALSDVAERWVDYPRADLVAFVRNSQFVIKTGHPGALRTWELWRPTVMSDFNNLDSLDVEHLLSYIEGQYVSVIRTTR